MCADKSSRQKFWLKPLFLYSLMIVLGIISGLSDVIWLRSLGLLIANIFIGIFKCISLPIIALSIIVTLASYRAQGSMQMVWRRTLAYTGGTTLVAAVISFVLYLLIKPGMVDINQPATLLPINQFNYLDHISSLIPSTILSPFIENQVMGVLFLSLVTGIAIRFIPEAEARHAITAFFKGAHGLFMVITGWVIAIIPLGLYGFITSTVVELQSGTAVKGIGEYLSVIILANLIQGLIILPLWLKCHKIKPFMTLKAMLPALSVAFFSKSSVGTLPITIETAEKNLNINPEISRFVLPLCTSLNMNGCAAFIFTTVIYLMQNNGIDITLSMMALWVLIAVIAAIGNAGVPMGCFFLSASLLASMNIPITLLGIILPFYAVIDMLETSLNVWSDSCIAKVVNEKMLTV